MNGETGSNEKNINYYLYDMERDKFIQERSDKKLLGFDTDSQGNKNYSKVNKIYTSLSSKKVKVFYKDLWYWDNLEVYLLKLDDK